VVGLAAELGLAGGEGAFSYGRLLQLPDKVSPSPAEAIDPITDATWSERIREGWAFAWAWTVLHTVGLVCMAAALDWLNLSIDSISKLLWAAWAGLTCLGWCQAWLLWPGGWQRLVWFSGWLLLPAFLPLEPAHAVFLAVFFILTIQSVCLYTTRSHPTFWPTCLIATSMVGMIGAILGEFASGSPLAGMLLPKPIFEVLQAVPFAALGWIAACFFAQGYVLAFLMPKRRQE
jgi:hypothetical protein